MPAQKRHKTKYPRVYYIVGSARGSTKKERIYYIVYRKAGKLIEEKAGRQFQDDMTPARAAQVRTMRVCGNQLSNKELGIAIGAGTDVALEASDITLMTNDLRSVPAAIKLSFQTMKVIKQNLFWAFFYNSLGITIAGGILYPFFGILLNPVFAAAAMAMSSVSVVSNSLRLRRLWVP